MSCLGFVFLNTIEKLFSEQEFPYFRDILLFPLQCEQLQILGSFTSKSRLLVSGNSNNTLHTSVENKKDYCLQPYDKTFHPLLFLRACPQAFRRARKGGCWFGSQEVHVTLGKIYGEVSV